MKKFILFVLLFIFSLPLNALEFKPNVSGEKEWKFGQKHTKYNAASYKYLETHKYFKELPSDIYEGSFYWKERLQLRIDGRLDKNLYVRYDIEEETDYPSRYNIFVKFYQHEFTFGDFEQEFKGGPFATLSKKLNGFRYQSENDGYNITFVRGEEKSETDVYIVNGDGVKTQYKMRHGPIVDGSVSVYVNGSKKKNGTDYTIEYSSYIVNMSSSYSSKDSIKFVYDYTNPIEAFIPTDKPQFTAARIEYMAEGEPKEVMNIRNQKENIDISFVLAEWSKSPEMESRSIFLNRQHLLTNTETLKVNGKVVSSLEYNLDYRYGKLFLPDRAWTGNERVEITYSYYQSGYDRLMFSGVGTIGPYKLNYRNIVKGSEKIKLNKEKLLYEQDYQIDYKKGEVTFKRSIKYQDKITVSYEYLKSEIKRNKSKEDSNFNGGVTWLNKTISADSNKSVLKADKENDDPSIVLSRKAAYYLDFWPVKVTPDVYVNNYSVDTSLGVEVDLDQGIVTIDYDIATYNSWQLNPTPNLKTLIVSSQDVSFSYEYFKAKGPVRYQFTGSSEREAFFNVPPGKTAFKYISDEANVIKRDRSLDDLIVLRHKRSGGSFAKKKLGEDYEIVYELDEIGRYSGQIGVVLYKKEIDDIYGFELDVDDVFEIEYFYVVSDESDPGDYKHNLFATDIKFKFSRNWDLKVDAAYSNKEYDKSEETNMLGDALSETGQFNSIYKLSHVDIAKGSEFFTFRGERKDMLPGVDYYMNYSKGEVKFINIALKESDEVIVFYNYYSSSGSNFLSKIDEGFAGKIETLYKDDRLNFSADITKVSDKFSPMAGSLGLVVPVGSEDYGGNIDYKLLKDTDIYVKARKTESNTGVDDHDGEEIKKRVTNYEYGLKYRPQNWLKMEAYKNEREEISDVHVAPVVTGNNYSFDKKIDEMGAKLGLGPSNFYTNIFLKDISSEDGYKDKYKHELDDTSILDIKNKFKLLSNITIDSIYGHSNRDVIGEQSQKKITDYRYYYGTRMLSQWFSSLSVDGGFKNMHIDKTVSYNAQENKDKWLHDFDYSIVYEPKWNVDVLKRFKINFNDEYKEQESISITQGKQKEQSKKYGIRLSPYYRANLSYDANRSNKDEGDRNKIRDNTSDTYRMTDFSLLENLIINDASYRMSLSKYNDKIPVNASENRSKSNMSDFKYVLRYEPFDFLTYINNSSFQNSNDDSTTSYYTTSNSRINQSPKNDTSHSAKFDIGHLWGNSSDFWSLGHVRLDLVNNVLNEKNDTSTTYFIPSENNRISDVKRSKTDKSTYSWKIFASLMPFNYVDTEVDFVHTLNKLFVLRENETRDIEKNDHNKIDIDFTVPLIAKLDLDSKILAENRKEWEWTNTSKNVELKKIENDYERKKNMDNFELISGLKYDAYDDVELESSFGFQSKTEEITLVTGNSNVTFETYSFISGITFYANQMLNKRYGLDIGDLVIFYRHYFDFTDSNEINGHGYRSSFSVKYTPFDIKNVKGFFTYSRFAVWGVNSNDTQQSLDQDVGRNQVDSEIAQQNLFKEEGKATLEIVVPIKNLGVQNIMERLVIDLSAVLTQAHDYKDDSGDKDYYLWSWFATFKVEL